MQHIRCPINKVISKIESSYGGLNLASESEEKPGVVDASPGRLSGDDSRVSESDSKIRKAESDAKVRKFEAARFEAVRFILKADAAIERLKGDNMAAISGCQETAAAKRASMDLTRALAAMRRYSE